MNFQDNLLLLTDSYKAGGHWMQYPPEVQKVYSYGEARRGGKFPATVLFGLQACLKRYLVGQVVTKEKIEEAANLFKMHFGTDQLFNREGWERLLQKHEGYLPISIKAVPEGTLVPESNILISCENTDIEFPWLTNYLETILMQALWYPTTVATLSYNMKLLILKYLEETGDPKLIDFKLHDFGFRGVSSVESAGIGGAAHLLNFKGTDTVAALQFVRQYYGEPMAGFSIPAAEHSTITSWGKNREADAYRNMLEQYPEGLVAVVSDSYDIYNACKTIWGKELRDLVLQRNGTVVIRPDSGSPCEVVPRVLQLLWDAFGGTVNSKGFKVLNDKIRVIQGDGISFESAGPILQSVKDAKFSTDNVAFGMGGKLLQGVDRDTQKFAFKCSNVTVDSVNRPVFKDPVTDPGKQSKKGKLALVYGASGLETVPDSVAEGGDDILQEVFYNGKLMTDYTFQECRDRINRTLGIPTLV